MPRKLCECGCGSPAPLADRTYNCRGIRKGEPFRYIRGHHPNSRLQLKPVVIPPIRLCACGCGLPTNLASKTSATFGWKKGFPVKFLQGHWNKTKKSPGGVDAFVERCVKARAERARYNWDLDPDVIRYRAEKMTPRRVAMREAEVERMRQSLERVMQESKGRRGRPMQVGKGRTKTQRKAS